MRLTDQENATDTVFDSNKAVDEFFSLSIRWGGTRREKLSGITAGCPSTPRGLMNDTVAACRGTTD